MANFLNGNNEPESIAKALIYPRVLATGQLQKVAIEVNGSDLVDEVIKELAEDIRKKGI